MKIRILITGISGFAGQHLADYIAKHQKNAIIYGLVRNKAKAQGSGIKAVVEQADIREAQKIKQIIRKIKPDKIFHLAAQVSVPLAWQKPQETFAVNVLGTINLLEAARLLSKKPKILITGSSAEYGKIKSSHLPIKEATACQPIDPYGVSKLTQTFLGVQYSRAYDLRIVMTRAFNHSGPGQKAVAVASRFAKEVAEIEAGKKEPVIKVGNLNVKRDFLDVRDVVRAYWLALAKGKSGQVYNICAGQAFQIKEILDTFLKLAKVSIKVTKDPTLFRQADIPLAIGSPAKFRRLTGWHPQYDFLKQTLPDLLNCWRKNYKLKTTN